MPERLAELLKQTIIEHYLTPERRRVAATHDRFVALCRLNGIAEEAIHGQRTTRRAIESLSPLRRGAGAARAARGRPALPGQGQAARNAAAGRGLRGGRPQVRFGRRG